MALRLSSGLPPGDGRQAAKSVPQNKKVDPESDRSGDLSSHLGELRTRLIRVACYMAIGMMLMWALSGRLNVILFAPVLKALSHLKGPPGMPAGTFVVQNFTDPFFIKLQIAMVGGLVVTVPFIMIELWGFVEPALTSEERRALLFVAPMSIALFLGGVACAYFIMPMAVNWFLSYLTSLPGTVLFQNPLVYIVFFVKLMLVFGLLFQLPVVLMFLGQIGLLTSAIMTKYWRQCAVGLFTLAMVVAPSNDPGTMLALAVPLTILFFFSIGLVKLVEPKKPRVV